MAKDVVYSESEFSIAKNKISEYIDFLCRVIESYTNELKSIQDQGIKDELIQKKLNKLSNTVKQYEKVLEQINNNVLLSVNRYTKNIENADNFQFTDDVTVAVSSSVGDFF